MVALLDIKTDFLIHGKVTKRALYKADYARHKIELYHVPAVRGWKDPEPEITVRWWEDAASSKRTRPVLSLVLGQNMRLLRRSADYIKPAFSYSYVLSAEECNSPLYIEFLECDLPPSVPKFMQASMAYNIDQKPYKVRPSTSKPLQKQFEYLLSLGDCLLWV